MNKLPSFLNGLEISKIYGKKKENILLPKKHDPLLNFNGEIEYVQKKYGKKTSQDIEKRKIELFYGAIGGLLKRGKEPQIIKEMKRISERLFGVEGSELIYKSGYVMLSGITRPVEITLNLCNNEGKEYTGYIKSLAEAARLRNMALYSIFDQKKSLVNFVYNDKYIVEAKAEGVVQKEFKAEDVIDKENFMMNYLNMKCSAAIAGVGDLHNQNIIISTCKKHKCVLIDYDVEENYNKPKKEDFDEGNMKYLNDKCGDVSEGMYKEMINKLKDDYYGVFSDNDKMEIFENLKKLEDKSALLNFRLEDFEKDRKNI